MEPREILYARQWAVDAILRGDFSGPKFLEDVIREADVLAKFLIDGIVPEKKEN